MLDDREPEAGATGGPVPRRVDAVEALEDPVELSCRDADAAVGDAEVDRGLVAGRGDHHGGALRRVGDGVGDQVAHRYGDLLAVAEEHEAVGAVLDELDVARLRVGDVLVDRSGDDPVDRDIDRLVERVVALQARELDDLLHQPGQPLALGVHPAGEALHRLGVVGGVDDGVGEQLDRTDRRLQLVAHVGHEVAPDRLDPAFAGPVLDQCEHQLGAQRCHPGGDVPRGQSLATHDQLGLADLAVPAYLPDELVQLVLGDVVPTDEAHRDGRCRCLQHVVLGIHDQCAALEDREHRGNSGREGRSWYVDGAHLPLTDPECEHGTASERCPEERKENSLESRAHVHDRTQGFIRAFGSWLGPSGTVHPWFTQVRQHFTCPP